MSRFPRRPGNPWPSVFQPPAHTAVKVCAECRQDWPCETELERIAMQDRIGRLLESSRKRINLR